MFDLEDIERAAGMDPDSADYRLRQQLAAADDALLESLVQMRKDKGLTQQDVATRLGRDKATVSNFERLDVDPHLSTIRRYAAAIGASVTHTVAHFDPQDSPAAAAPARGGPPPVIYQLRPSWRPRFEPDVFVPADLGLLTGPLHGSFDPPVNLYWQPGSLDFSDPGDLRLFYASALTRAGTAEQFATWINARAVIANWPAIALPSRVRAAWETIHPMLRDQETAVNPRLRIQDHVLSAIADEGFALAGGSALIDYDVVARDSEDIDAFYNRLDAAAFDRAAAAVIETCSRNGWPARLVFDQNLDKQIKVTVPGDGDTVVQLVYHQRSADPERRRGGGLRLIFADVVGGKAAAMADAARGRDFDDIAHVVQTRGWSLRRVVEAMERLGYPDRAAAFWHNIERFRRGEFDAGITQAGFDPAFSHSVLDAG